jgi:hypothetical protein
VVTGRLCELVFWHNLLWSIAKSYSDGIGWSIAGQISSAIPGEIFVDG